MKIQARIALALLAAGFLTGCSSAGTTPPGGNESSAQPQDVSLSSACEAAVVKALEDEQELYDTHPLWTAEQPGVDGSPEAWAEYDALAADEEAQWVTAYAPIYSTCSSPAEWWAAANEYPRIAGVTDSAFVSPEDITTWCSQSLDQPACIGIDEWLATNPR